MSGWPLLYLLTVWAVIVATSSTSAKPSSSSTTTLNARKAHRLIGGHLKIFHEDSQDTELLTASASGSKDSKSAQKSDEEEKKTLSQQVADGKYGLIQKEFFTKPSKRPGVISYESNPEVPKDNINNLGGLTKNDIWLAENHLLVLKGGTYPAHDDKHQDNSASGAPIWPAIDDYTAPLRQVKIPAHPKVPPPFPVQLTDDGPLQILGTNSSRTLNGTFEEGAIIVPPPEGYEPGTGPFFPNLYPYPSNTSTGQGPFPIPPYPAGEYGQGAPFPPLITLNGTLPPYFASLPPGTAILPPPPPPHLLNQTEAFDEDDPSIYYPPPYSFYFPKDNSSRVPAGPLVPGIILPPPPNFFGPLEDKSPARKPMRMRPPSFTSTTTPLPQIHPTTTAVPPTSIVFNKTTKKPIRIPVHIPSEINNELNPIVTTLPPQSVVTIVPIVHPQQPTKSRLTPTRTHKTRPPSVTILKPIKPSNPIYVYKNSNNNDAPRKPFNVYGPPPPPPSSPQHQQQGQRAKTVVSTTQIPLKVYYSTSEIETNSITQPPQNYIESHQQQQQQQQQQQLQPHQRQRMPKTSTSKSPAQYYYYEEHQNQQAQRQNDQQTTRKPYFDIPKEYYVQAKPVAQNSQPQPPPPPSQQQYIYVTARPYNTQRPRYRFVQQTPKTDTFSIHIARLQKQIQQYYTTPRPIYRQSPKPVYQFSFEAANYHRPQQQQQLQAQQEDPQDKFRPLPKYSVQIQPAIEIIPTPEPPAYQQNTPQPIYYQQQQNYPTSTERPVASKYYNTPRPVDYDYEDEAPQQQQQKHQQGRPISQYSFEATPNPIYQGYYTKPDEGYFDENTKQYFTTFGKKLPSGTTPLPQIIAAPGKTKNHHTQQHQQQISLESDTRVNYLNPRPPINPDSEFVPINPPPGQRLNYPQVVKYSSRPQQANQKDKQQQQIHQQQQHAEIIKAVPVNVPQQQQQQQQQHQQQQQGGTIPEGQPGSFISYELPGDDGAHFYFLTPQLAQRRDQGAGYYYEQPAQNAPRIRRDNNSER